MISTTKLKSFIRPAVREIQALGLKGEQVYCPICDRHFKTFLPGGPTLRPNSRCPVCDSLERHRLLWLTLNSLWQNETISRGGRMLHIAPEQCLSKLFRRNYDYLSVDQDERFAMQFMDIREINAPSNTFDAIICNHVLEHVPEDRKAISELFRVLKPSGWASIQVPMIGEVTQEDLSVTDPKQREQLYGQADHVRQYGQDFRDRLEEAGFEVLVLSAQKMFKPVILEKIAVGNETEVWISLKRD